MANQGAVPTNIPMEYTRGNGAFIPSGTTAATTSGLTSAAQSVNGQTGNITVKPGVVTGATMTVTPNNAVPGELDINLAVTAQQPIVPTGTSNPSSPVAGQLFFRTDIVKLLLYTGSTWVGVVLS